MYFVCNRKPSRVNPPILARSRRFKLYCIWTFKKAIDILYLDGQIDKLTH